MYKIFLMNKINGEGLGAASPGYISAMDVSSGGGSSGFGGLGGSVGAAATAVPPTTATQVVQVRQCSVGESDRWLGWHYGYIFVPK